MDGHGNYAAGIDETHHVHKLDAPSGTAITLAQDLAMRSLRYTGWAAVGPESAPPANDAVPVVSHRSGEVPGTHEVRWESAEDRLSIRHEAFGRQGFAMGAVVAAEWLKGRTGLFTMDDVLEGGR